jgi:hypothetical protein
MTASRNEENNTCTLHICTTGGLGIAISLDLLRHNGPPEIPAWTKIVENIREQYDLNRDLGGQAVTRMWGLTSYRGVTAVLFTRHPTDMIEYRVASDEDATVAFASDAGDIPDEQTLFAPRAEKQESHAAQSRREAVSSFLLSEGDGAIVNTENQKLIYAAACCGIVDGHSSSVRSESRKSFERLARETGTDMSEEISKCASESSTIPPKSSDQLNQPGGHLFERCEICSAGIAWFSPQEAQCANGHLFGMHCKYLRPGFLLSSFASTLWADFLGYPRTRDVQILLCLPHRVHGRGVGRSHVQWPAVPETLRNI